MGVGAPAMDEQQAASIKCRRPRRPQEVVDRTIRDDDDVFFPGAGDGALEPERRGGAEREPVGVRREILHSVSRSTSRRRRNTGRSVM